MKVFVVYRIYEGMPHGVFGRLCTTEENVQILGVFVERWRAEAALENDRAACEMQPAFLWHIGECALEE